MAVCVLYGSIKDAGCVGAWVRGFVVALMARSQRVTLIVRSSMEVVEVLEVDGWLGLTCFELTWLLLAETSTPSGGQRAQVTCACMVACTLA